MEAAQSLTNDILNDDKKDGIRHTDESSGDESDEADAKPNLQNKDDFRSNSIAALRAKAQEHSARLFGEGQKLFGGQNAGEQQQQQQQQQRQQQHMFSSLDNSSSVF